MSGFRVRSLSPSILNFSQKSCDQIVTKPLKNILQDGQKRKNDHGKVKPETLDFIVCSFIIFYLNRQSLNDFGPFTR